MLRAPGRTIRLQRVNTGQATLSVRGTGFGFHEYGTPFGALPCTPRFLSQLCLGDSAAGQVGSKTLVGHCGAAMFVPVVICRDRHVKVQ